jgi:ligand-binding sensor domain-containing protein
MTLQSHLNRLFISKATKRKPGVAVVDGIEVTKSGSLWVAEVNGKVHRNTHLADIKAIIREAK